MSLSIFSQKDICISISGIIIEVLWHLSRRLENKYFLRRMVCFMQLPFHVVDLIITLLAISSNGAREIVHVSATCKILKYVTERAHILRKVNFQCLAYTEDFTKHHHPKDLLLVCTQAGNVAAKLIFAKALLYNDRWFRQMIEYSNQEAYDVRLPHKGLLDYRSIVRSFIERGSCTDIIRMRYHLVNYVIRYAGYNVADRFGILEAIESMCTLMARRIHEYGIRSLRLSGTVDMSPSLLNHQVRGDRVRVLGMFDALFPTVPA
ncbi:hypothetical protein QVD17_33637 [Tagetes erecta]|uniref:Uncharacterized protein n=1 Tax=Tagetes erecta TaxID=13708 RepID=A0AAD8JYL0_TARER|nr:hypothetical protein QVD17_33637 [Tagetes erecta]